ncbi:MAG: citrate synthase [Myxococcota bacterium]
MASDSLTITDNRTGQTYEVPVSNGTISAMDLRQIKTSDDDFGLMSYDPAYKNTASTKSRITFIDGENGILRYRGYPIEQLAEQASFLEVSYLLYYGELPSKSELKEYQHEITHHTMVHENVRELVDAFRYDAHPMGILASMYAALSTFYPDAKNVRDAEVRKLQMHRLIAKTPTLAAYAYRHRRGLPYVYPDNDLSYAGNFLNMLFKMTEVKYQPNPIIEKALDVLFILHADHEQNCSASAMRSVGSSETDPFSATAAACAALYGPLHGGANEAVVRMLTEIGSVSNIKDYVAKAKGGEVRLMGFGHRVYKNYDPRAKVIKKLAYQVFDEVGKNPLIDIAVELEKIALEDEYFVKRKLYPNVDFYSGLIYQSMGLPMDLFPVLFAIGRMPGWVSQWCEMLEDSEQKIARPRQIYLGEGHRDYRPLVER